MAEGDEARAAVAAARARLSQAQRALRKAARAVAQAHDGFDPYGHAHITKRDPRAAQQLIDAALAEHDEVDVIVLTAVPPSSQSPHPGAQTERTP